MSEPSVTQANIDSAEMRQSFQLGRSDNLVASHQLHVHRRCRDILDLASACQGDDATGLLDGEFESLLTDAAASIRKLDTLCRTPNDPPWLVNAWSMDSPLTPTKDMPTSSMGDWTHHLFSRDRLATLIAMGSYDLHKAPYGCVSLGDMCNALLHCRIFTTVFYLRPGEDGYMADGPAIGFSFGPSPFAGRNFHNFRPSDYRVYRVALDDLIAAFEQVAWMEEDEEVFRARLDIPPGGPDFIDRNLLIGRSSAIMKPISPEWRAPWHTPRPNHPDEVADLLSRPW